MIKLLIIYLVSLLACFSFGIFDNWKELHTVRDFLTPFRGDFQTDICLNFAVFIPLLNSVIAIVYCLYYIMIFISFFLKKCGLSKLIDKILNLKIK